MWELTRFCGRVSIGLRGGKRRRGITRIPRRLCVSENGPRVMLEQTFSSPIQKFVCLYAHVYLVISFKVAAMCSWMIFR